jgi:hypothetical protein
MQATPPRDATAPERRRRIGRARVVVVLATVAGLCGGAAPAGSVPPLLPPAVVAVPQVSIPSVSVPSVTTPSISLPAAPVPSVSTPSVSTPSVSTPSVPVPSVPAPSVSPPPSVSAPSTPAPRVSTPSVSTLGTPGAPAASGRPSPSSATSAGSAGQPSPSSAPSDSASLAPDASGTGRRAPSSTRSRMRRTGDARGTAAMPAIRTSPHAVRRALRELHGCVSSLPTADRSLLRQRAGSVSAAPRSLAALSDSLGISRAGVIHRLRRAVGELRTAARATGCAGSSVAADLQTGSSTSIGSEDGALRADRSAVLGVSAHGGPSRSSRHESASGSEVAPRPASEATGPSTGLLVALVLLMLAITAVGALASRRVGASRRPRRRRTVTPRVYSFAARAGFRYSHLRDALVLRGIGERFGPVLVCDSEGGSGRRRAARAPLEPGLERAEAGASRRVPGGAREGRGARRHAGPRR